MPETKQAELLDVPAENQAERAKKLAEGLKDARQPNADAAQATLAAAGDAAQEGLDEVRAPGDRLAVGQRAAVPDRLPAWGVGEGWLAEYERIAMRVAGAVTLPEALTEDRGRNPYPVGVVSKNVLTVALAGRELGIGFMESLRQIHIIKGQTALSSELKMALAKRAGLIIDEVDESNGCRIVAHRNDTGEKGEGKFTPEDKKLAKLGTTADSGWDKYPSDMYWARAGARLIRRVMPDAKGASFRSVEELSDEKGEGE